MKLRPDHIATAIMRHRLVILAVIGVLTVCSILQVRKLGVYNELDIWVDASSDQYVNYRHFFDHFGQDESIIVLFRSDSLSTNRHLQLNYQFTDSLRAIAGVKDVVSLASIHIPSGVPVGPASVPLLPRSVSNPERIKDRIMHYRTIQDFLYSADFKTTSFTVFPETSSDSGEMIEQIQSLATRYLDALGAHVIIGVAPLKESLNALSIRESRRFLMVSGLIILIVSFVFFRRIREASLPLFIALITICWTLALMALAGIQFNVVMSVMPLVLLVIVIANAIHFITGQQAASAVCADKQEAVVRNFSNKFYKCLYSSLTTAVAFLSFTLSSLMPLKYFGVFSATGVMLSFVLCFLLLAIVYSYLPVAPKYNILNFESVLKRGWLSGFALRHKMTILALSVMIFLVSVVGITRIQVNTDQVSYYKKEHPIRLATEQAQQWMSGIVPFELVFKLDTSIFESCDAFLSNMRHFELALAEVQAVKSIQSLATLLDDFGSARGGGSMQSMLLQPSMIEKTGLSYFVSSDGMNVRTTIRTPWMREKEILVLLQQMEQIIEETLQSSGTQYYFTGAAVVFARMGNRLVKSQVKSFSFTFLVIFALFFMLHRKLRIALLCLLPNILPVAATLGLMGWLKIPLDVSTVLIASVSFGIAVDDTIHFVGTYMDGRKTLDLPTSVDRAFGAVGKPLVITTLLFVGGFLVMVFSSYRPLVFLGVFTSVNIVLALVSDLLVLPAMLMIGRRD